jgi:hypothetical protein
MGYVILPDYKKSIQTETLNQIHGNDVSLLTSTENRAIQDVKSYLSAKYNTDNELTDTPAWAYGVVRYAKGRFYLDANTYSGTALYPVNTLTLYNGNVYICTNAILAPQETFTPSNWTLLGPRYTIFYAQNPKEDWNYYTSYNIGSQVFYNNKTYTALVANSGYVPTDNPSYWGTGTSYSIAGSILPTNTVYFTLGDNRNQQLLGCIIDIVLYYLHARIAPMNVPEHRWGLYKDAISFLKNVAKGDDMNVSIEKIQPNAGMRNVYGSSQTKSNNNV